MIDAYKDQNEIARFGFGFDEMIDELKKNRGYLSNQKKFIRPIALITKKLRKQRTTMIWHQLFEKSEGVQKKRNPSNSQENSKNGIRTANAIQLVSNILIRLGEQKYDSNFKRSHHCQRDQPSFVNLWS
jgi:hypothetical protein